ncbi:MAG TPA: UDP-N-acetylmuramoyl-tripeptide--D-alanyl-D-alanine ligase [Streptosporangiaceae bacterium]
MIPISLTRIAEVTGSRICDAPDPDALVTGPAVIDSREAEPGTLFVALPGERADGHDFAAAAVAAGATAVLGDRPVGVPALVTEPGGVLDALGRLARANLDALPGTTVVGLTGSAGKTSTKDMLGALCARLGATIAPPGSFNNEIGHPLTVLRADAGTRYLVLEVSARGIGHIAYLCGIAPPRIGVVLNVGTAHLGEFGSRDAIARAKGELVEALPSAADGGIAVLNADDPMVAGMKTRTAARVVWFGRTETADVRAADVLLDSSGRAAFTLVTPEGSAPVRLGVYGGAQVSNALAAAAVARELGMPVGDIAAALGEIATISRWRMEVTERPDGVTVVNDAYNANPDSVRAALDTLSVMAPEGHGVAVLGGMAELGPQSEIEHERAGAHAVASGVRTLVAVGDDAAPILAGAKSAPGWTGEAVGVPDAEAAAELLRNRLGAGDVVLVKGSRVAGLERVAQALLAGSRQGGHA